MSEKEIQTDIMTMLVQHKRVAWAFVTTTGVVRAKGYFVTLGFPGMADIIMQLKDGRLGAIEVKSPGKKPSEYQLDFIENVKNNNGVAGWCDSVAGAMKILEG